MNNSPTIFILSDNRDFIEPFSGIVTRELGVICRVVASEAEVLDGGGAVLVTDRSLSKSHQLPVIKVNLPIRINGLLSDIQSALEDTTNNDIVEVGSDLRLSLQNKILNHISSELTIDLTDKESQLLQAIAQAGESGISREYLLKEVWGMDSVLDTHTLETHIYRLRKKIKDAFDSEMIKAFEGGYRL